MTGKSAFWLHRCVRALSYDAEMQQELKNKEAVKAGAQIVHHNADALGTQALKPADGWWLYDIKGAKKYEACKLRLPGDRGGDEGEHLAGNFIDHDVGWVVAVTGARGEGCGGDSDGSGQGTIGQGSGNEQVRGQVAGDQRPGEHGSEGTPGSGTGLERTRTKEGRDGPGPVGTSGAGGTFLGMLPLPGGLRWWLSWACGVHHSRFRWMSRGRRLRLRGLCAGLRRGASSSHCTQAHCSPAHCTRLRRRIRDHSPGRR